MAMKLATAYVDITARDAGFKRGISDMRSDLQSQISSLGSLLGTIGAGAAIGGVVKGAINIASSIEQSEVAFNVMLKDMAKTRKLLGELQEFAAKTPFESTEVKRSAQSMLAFRHSAEDLPAYLQMLGDAAAGTGSDLNELTRVFNKVKSVGKLTGETFEQFAERGVNLRVELQDILGKTGDEIVKMQSKGQISFDHVVQAMQKMTQEGGMFYKAMERQSTTAGGLWSTLQDGITMSAAAFGKTLLPAWKATLRVAIGFFESLIALNEATGGFVAHVGVATTAIAGLTTAFIAARAAARLLGITMKSVLIGTGFGAVIVVLGTVLALIYRIVSAIAEQAPVVEAWKEAVAKFGLAWERVKTAVANAWTAIKEIVWDALEAIANFFGTTLGDMKSGSGDLMADMLTALSDWVLNAAQWLQVFSENWSTTWEIVKNGALILLLGLRDLFTINLTTIIGYALGRQIRLFVDFFAFVVKLAWKAISTIGEILARIFTNIWEGIKNLFRGKDFGDVLRGALDTMVKEASDFGEAFAAGWNKENPFKLLEASSGLKAALKRQEELFDKLRDRKRALEQEDLAALQPEAAAAPGEKPKPEPPKPAAAAKEPKLEAGFFAFDALQRSIQEQVLKAETADEKLVKQGDAAAIAREEMNEHLKTIETNTADAGAVATS
jgi:tape measure domain-containing protein